MAHDPIVGFEAKGGLQDVDGFGEDEEDTLNMIDVKFPNEVEDHVEDCVQN